MSMSTTPVFGPDFRSTLDLRGIRRIEGEGGGGGGEGGEGGEGGSGGESKYTPPADQAALDRIIESRLAREREKFKDYDALVEKAKKADELIEAAKTDAERAIDAAKGEATTATTQKFLTRIVNAEVKALAGAAGFNDPADALQVVDPANLPVKDDEPDTDAIKAAVEQLAKDKPYLLKADPVKKTPVTRPKPKDGDKPEHDNHEGKGRAAAALRQLGVARKGGTADI
jgi:hypothetical protein